MKTVADQVVETLAAVGGNRIYGIVGDSLNGLTDSAPYISVTRKWRRLPLEQTRILSASSRYGAGSCGPGNLHLINGGISGAM
jgi:pyruvate dehydrogenase (quinone)